jgi:predicted nucleotidyltransferase
VPCLNSERRHVRVLHKHDDSEAQQGEALVNLDILQTEKRTAILALARLHGPSNVRVFGSAAKRQNNPDSDVDFLVDLDAGRDLFDLGGLQADLRDLFSASVDSSKRLAFTLHC